MSALRFVILAHDHPQPHFDFMLETGSFLRTWRLDHWPTPNEVQEAIALSDHRLAYLEYEGPVSGQRGSVTRLDQGTYEILRQSESVLVVVLKGTRLQGQATLRDHQNHWEFQWTSSISLKSAPSDGRS